MDGLPGLNMKYLLPLLIVTLSEASIGVFVKLVGDSIPIFTLNFYRVFFAAIFLLLAVPLVTKEKIRFPEGNTKDILIVGFLIALQISFFNAAMSMAPIANVVIFWSVAPFFTFIFSTIFLNERPRNIHVMIFLLAIVGIVLAKPLDGGHMAGNLIALVDGAVYSAMITYIRYEGTTERNVDIFWFMTAASAYLLPFFFLFGPGEIFRMVSYPGFTVPVLLWSVCLGMVSTGVAFLFISIVLKHINANIYSLIDIIVSPVVASIFGYLVFGEVPGRSMIIGGSILLLSGAWLTRTLTDTESVHRPAA